MKIRFLVLIMSLALFPISSIAGNSVFIDQINAQWKSRSYDQILQTAAVEANKQPPNPEAYAVLFGYHVFISADRPSAIQDLTQLANLLQTKQPDSALAVLGYLNEFKQHSVDGLPPATPQTLDRVHELLVDEFPIKALLLMIAKAH